MTRALSVILLNSLITLGFTTCQPGKQTTTTIRVETPTAQAPPNRQMPPPESQPESQPSGPAAPIIDPKADRILKEMSDYLKAQGQFRLHVQISQDDLLPTGQKIQFEAVNDIAVRRPDRIFSEYRGDTANKRYWYDGKTVTLFDLDTGIYATIDVPSTIDGALDSVMKNYGFAPPLSDLLYSDFYSVVHPNIQVELFVGKSEVDGVACNHLAFVGKYADWQIWIEEEKTRVPRKVVITYKTIPGSPQFSAILSQWDFTTPLAAALFVPEIPQGSDKTEFLPLIGQK